MHSFSVRLLSILSILWIAHGQNQTNAPASVSTIAGTPIPGDVEAQGDAARFSYPTDVALLPDEKSCVVADSANNKIKIIKSSDWRVAGSGVVATLAGNGIQGWLDGDSTTARFKKPLGVAVHPGGTWVAVADSSNHRIRTVDLATGAVDTLAGSGRSGYIDGTATFAQMRNPSSVVFNAEGTGLAIADEGNYRIRWFNISTEYMSTLSGSRIKNPMCGYGSFVPSGSCPKGRCQCPGPADVSPCGEFLPERPSVDYDYEKEVPELMCCLAVDYDLLQGDPTMLCYHGLDSPGCTNPEGATTGCVCTGPNTGQSCSDSSQCTNGGICVGSAEYHDGVATRSAFRAPSGVTFTQDFRHLYVVDSQNHLIRTVDVSTGASSSVAGVPQRKGNLDADIIVDAGPAVGAAVFNFPASVSVPRQGNWYLVIDRLNARVRRVDLDANRVVSVTGWTACRSGKYTPKGGCWTLADCLCNESIRTDTDASYCLDGSNPDDVPNDGITPPCTCSPANEGGTCTIDRHCTGGGQCETWSVGYEDGAASSAKFRDPIGSALVSDGTGLLVADSGNHAIRYVDCGGSCGSSTIVVDLSVELMQQTESVGAVHRCGLVALAFSLLMQAWLVRLWVQ